MKHKLLTKIFALIIVLTLSIQLFGCKKGGEGTATPPPPPTPVPPIETSVFVGADDTETLQGGYLDLFDRVKAFDDDGNEISKSITIDGGYDFSRVGEYTVNYRAEDTNGKEYKHKRVIKVKENSAVNQNNEPPTFTSDGDYCISLTRPAFGEHMGNMRANFATDGDLNTRYETPHDDGPYNLTIDLGLNLDLSYAEIYWEAAKAAKYSISVSSDNRTYSQVESFSTPYPINSPNCQTVDLGVKARYVRLNFVERVTAYGYSVYEFKIFGKEGIVPPAGKYDDIAYFDRTLNEEWFEVDLMSIKPVNRVSISYADYISAKELTLLSSIDGVNYETVRDEKNGGNNFTNLNLNARYIRAEFHSRPLRAKGYIINGFSVYDASDTAYPSSSLSASASSFKEGFEADNGIDGNWGTFWSSDYLSSDYKTFDIGKVGDVGGAEFNFEQNQGKVYDVEISSDGVDFTLIHRQIHGAQRLQKINIYKPFRYLRLRDYSNSASYSYQLNWVKLTSCMPDGKADTDANKVLPKLSINNMGGSSYISGEPSFPTARYVDYLAENLKDRPIPSNDWWQSLLINNLGHRMALNPLTAKFTDAGLGIANPGEGYFYGSQNDRTQTITDDTDLFVFTEDLNAAKLKTTVVGYSDFGINVGLSDDSDYYKMLASLNQGGAYAYLRFFDRGKPYLQSNNLVALYDDAFNAVLKHNDDKYESDHIYIEVKSIAAYDNVGGVRTPIYENRFYCVNAPVNTVFTRLDNKIYIELTGGNYLSVGAAANKSALPMVYQNGYAFAESTRCDYTVDNDTNIVKTEYAYKTIPVKNGVSGDTLCALLPHQYDKCGQELTDYRYNTIRGDMKLKVGGGFITHDRFLGIVPQFVEPDNEEYSRAKLTKYLNKLDSSTNGNLLSGDPYWQGKNLQPIALGVLAAEEIGETALRDSLLNKIKIILIDWFTYTAGEDGTYFYYDDEWKTLYYKYSEFGANVGITDHHFTYGYYLMAAAVLCMYDSEFFDNHHEFIEFMIRDFANPDREDAEFPLFRSFDPFAGHSWAGGYADNDSGNNQEAGGESLHGYVGMYLYSLVSGNEKLKNAAIYIFTTELAAIKEYWFNYFERAYCDDYPYAGVGQIYGTTNFYGTFFNGDPVYIYGIHWLPGSEFLTSYVTNDFEKQRFKSLFDRFEEESKAWTGKEEYAWHHIAYPMQALFDAAGVLTRWNEDSLDSVEGAGIEAFNMYYIVNSMLSLGGRTDKIWAKGGVGATVYQKDGKYSALAFNPTSQSMTVEFADESGTLGAAILPPRSIQKVDPEDFTSVKAYRQVASENYSLSVTDYDFGDAVKGSGFIYSLSKNYSASYLLAFDIGGEYNGVITASGSGKIVIKDNFGFAAAEVNVNGSAQTSYAFNADFYGKQKLTLTVTGDVKIYQLNLNRVKKLTNVAAGSSVSNNGAAIVDGNFGSRWIADNGGDSQTLTITLKQLAELSGVRINFEAAYAKEYKIYLSIDGIDYDLAYHRKDFAGIEVNGMITDNILFDRSFEAKYIKLELIKKATVYPYSIYEFEALSLM